MLKSLFKSCTLVALLFLVGCARIGPGHVGIVVSMAGDKRGVNDIPVTTGWVFYNAFATNVFEYPTYMQSVVWSKSVDEGHPVNEEITFSTADSMQVAVDLSVGYTLISEKVPHFYVKFRNDDLKAFTHGFFRNLAREKVDEVAGKYKIDQIMGDNAEFLKTARAALQTAVEPFGIKIEQFGLTGYPRPPQAVVDAINAKIAAVQLSIQKQNELVQSQAEAAKAVATAEGQAKSILVVATAQAEANKKLSDSLTANLIDLKRLEKWNGVLPQVSGGNTPFINLNREK